MPLSLLKTLVNAQSKRSLSDGLFELWFGVTYLIYGLSLLFLEERHLIYEGLIFIALVISGSVLMAKLKQSYSFPKIGHVIMKFPNLKILLIPAIILIPLMPWVIETHLYNFPMLFVYFFPLAAVDGRSLRLLILSVFLIGFDIAFLNVMDPGNLTQVASAYIVLGSIMMLVSYTAFHKFSKNKFKNPTLSLKGLKNKEKILLLTSAFHYVDFRYLKRESALSEKVISATLESLIANNEIDRKVTLFPGRHPLYQITSKGKA